MAISYITTTKNSNEAYLVGPSEALGQKDYQETPFSHHNPDSPFVEAEMDLTLKEGSVYKVKMITTIEDLPFQSQVGCGSRSKCKGVDKYS